MNAKASLLGIGALLAALVVILVARSPDEGDGDTDAPVLDGAAGGDGAAPSPPAPAPRPPAQPPLPPLPPTPPAPPAPSAAPAAEPDPTAPAEPIPTGDGRTPAERAAEAAQTEPTPDPIERPRPAGHRPSTLPSDRDGLVGGIRDGFADLRPQLRECYELLLELDPDAEDRIVFRFEVTADPDDPERGAIELQQIESATLVIEDVSCFAELIDELEVPPPADPEGYYSVSYPVVLDSE